MRPGPVEPLGRGQFLWFVAVSVVAGGVYIWPETLMRTAGPMAPWCIIASVLLSMLITTGDVWWTSRTQGDVFLDRLYTLWGFPAYLWGSVQIAFLFLLDASLVNLFSDMMQAFYYPHTPLWALRGALMLLAGWMGGLSLAHLSRAAQFWLPLLIAGFVFLAVFSIAAMHKTFALLPAVSPLQVRPLVQGTVTMWYLWMASPVVVTLANFSRPSARLRIWSAAMLALLVQGLVVVAVYAVVVGTLGPRVTGLLAWPLLYVLNNLQPVSFIIARAGALIIPTWAIAALLYVSAHTATMSVNVQMAVHANARFYRVTSALFTVAIYAGTWLWSTPHETARFVVDTWDPLALGWAVLLTAATALLSLIRGPLKENGEPALPASFRKTAGRASNKPAPQGT